MDTFGKILAVIALLVFAFITYQTIKHHPEWFSKQNLTKAFSSMGVLALLLIAFVAFLVFMLRLS